MNSIFDEDEELITFPIVRAAAVSKSKVTYSYRSPMPRQFSLSDIKKISGASDSWLDPSRMLETAEQQRLHRLRAQRGVMP
jgi:hypothetical protein